jgi:hypothetical protein
MKRVFMLALVCFLALVSAGCRVVTSDNYILRSGETLSGDLTVSGGDATLEQGSRVTGSLFVTGGLADANGQIDGDVLVTGGDLNFGPSSVVLGVVQKTGGDVRIAAGAKVQSGESSGVQNPARLIRNLTGASILIPILLVVVVVILLTSRTTRRAAPQTAVGQGAGDASAGSSAAQSSAPAERGAGLGGSIVLGIILVGLGILFLLQELLKVDVWHFAWPFLVIVAGLVCFAAMVLGGRSTGRLAIPGSIVTVVGLILLYQNTFDQFENWAYAWALIFPTSFGIGHYIEGRWTGRPALRERGIRETRTGLIIFVILAAFFELVINLSGFYTGDLGRYAFPALLILIGVLLLFSRFLSWPAPKPAMQTPAGSGTLPPVVPTESDRKPPAER